MKENLISTRGETNLQNKFILRIIALISTWSTQGQRKYLPESLTVPLFERTTTQSLFIAMSRAILVTAPKLEIKRRGRKNKRKRGFDQGTEAPSN